MSIAAVISAIGFAAFIFPVHIYNYVYIDTSRKFASLNIGLFKNWNFFNVNTIEDKPGEMSVNGKETKLQLKKPQLFFYRVFNVVYIRKIVQLCDIGIKNQNNAYIALAQNALTYALYKFIDINGGRSKLRNYTILNEEHGDIRYYAKTVTVINLLVVTRIFLLYLREKMR